jgi:tripartite-type tricarboxylate transporter receptor subunit TctC
MQHDNNVGAGRMRRVVQFLLLSLAFGVLNAPVRAQEPFFKGKTLTIQVGSTSGGSASSYAQALARHIGKHIPGAPQAIVQHVPGAGGYQVANNIYSLAPRDRTTIAVTTRAFATAPLLGHAYAKYDPRQLGWLGSTSVEYSTCFARAGAQVTSVQDLSSKELIVGAAGSGGTASTFAELANKLLGAKIKIISGYPGSTEVILALERGEIDGYCGLSWVYIKLRKPDWIEQHKINILFQMGPTKHPDLPNVPFLPDLAKNEHDRKIAEFILIPQAIGRPFFTPPGLPADRLAMLQSAFAETLRDPAFLAEAQKLKLEVELVMGKDAARIVERLYEMPEDVVREAGKLLN